MVPLSLLPSPPRAAAAVPQWRLSRLLEYLVTRLESRGHCLIAIAEGAECVEQQEARKKAAAEAAAAGTVPVPPKVDASGEAAMDDGALQIRLPMLPAPLHPFSPAAAVGAWLKDRISAHFKKAGKVCNVKYIDPSYTIRSAVSLGGRGDGRGGKAWSMSCALVLDALSQPANAADSALCTHLAFNAVHAAMSGKTGFSIGE